MTSVFRATGFGLLALVALIATGVNAQSQPSPDRVIKHLDKDGDNLVSFEEFEMPRRGRERSKLAAADRDGDGNVSREEMQAHIDARAEEAMERFELADLNDDGFLTEEEIKRALFDTIDSNGDGYIDAVELGDARRSRGQGRTG